MKRIPLSAAAALLVLMAAGSASARRLRDEDDVPEVQASAEVAPAQEPGANRKPRFFFETTETSTTTTTSTLSTVTYCWSTQAGAVTTTCTRKRRAIITDPLEELRELMPDLILPSAASQQKDEVVETAKAEEGLRSRRRESKVMDLNQLDSLQIKPEDEASAAAAGRDPRFLWYWLTSTSTSTSTTTSTVFTTTTTIQYTVCTPAASLVQMCG